MKNTFILFEQIIKYKLSHCDFVSNINDEIQANIHREETDGIMSHPCVEHTAIVNSAAVDLHTGNSLLLCY